MKHFLLFYEAGSEYLERRPQFRGEHLRHAWGAAERSHTEIARWVAGEHGVKGWSSQSVTVSYERARGGRAVGEHVDGFAITASKTVAVPVERLYEAFVNGSRRKRWLPDGKLRVRTSSKPMPNG